MTDERSRRVEDSRPPSVPAIEQTSRQIQGELAQLGERLVCNQEVTGSSPVFSTSLRSRADAASYGWQASDESRERVRAPKVVERVQARMARPARAERAARVPASERERGSAGRSPR